jgi:flagellar protein FliS
MMQDPYRNHIQETIVTASPVELVAMLYAGLLDAVQTARRGVRERDIRSRATAISRGLEILLELASSLDHQQGGEIAARLGGLYAFIGEQLQQANFKQTEEPLERAETIIATLAGAWQELVARERTAMAAAAPATPNPYQLDGELSSLSICG